MSGREELRNKMKQKMMMAKNSRLSNYGKNVKVEQLQEQMKENGIDVDKLKEQFSNLGISQPINIPTEPPGDDSDVEND